MKGNPLPDSIDLFIEHHRLIFASSEDAVLLIDPISRKVLEANRTAQSLLVYFTGSLIGADVRNFDWFNQLPKKSDLSDSSRIMECSSISGLYIPRENGTHLVVDLLASQCVIEETTLCHLTLRDVSKQRQIEDKLNVYIQRLEWSNRELQEFAYVASHDLQEPLRAIQAFADRLVTNYRDDLGPEGQEYLERVNESATRMRTLINDLLAYSRVTSKARTLTSVSLNAILESVCDDLETPIRESGAVIEVGDLPDVHANSTLMRQLFQNIISNSVKYRKADTPPIIRVFAISGSPISGHPNTPHNPGNDTVDVIVNDNGIGFDQKYAERIFGPFQRLHSQRRYQGTGIGLAICRKITELCSGTISATSESNVGTSIHIKLPTRATSVITE